MLKLGTGLFRPKVCQTLVQSSFCLRPAASLHVSTRRDNHFDNLEGKTAFVAGVGDDQGYGWAIARALADRGAKLVFGTWPPVLGIFRHSWKTGKFDKSRKLGNGKLLDIEKVYALDATFDTPDDVPPEIKKEKRYSNVAPYTVEEVAALVKKDFGKIDFLVHSLANGPEVQKPLLDTSRKGYLAAVNASAYSLTSLVRNFGPLMPAGSSVISLSYLASVRAVPGYGGGMSSGKAALESDTRTLAWDAGRRWGIRVNSISAGGLRSRAARAIGFIDGMIAFERANAPLVRELEADDVGRAALFLLSPAASGITGVTLYVDNGVHVMGYAVDSQALTSTLNKGQKSN